MNTSFSESQCPVSVTIDRRSSPRFKANAFGIVTNITTTKQEMGSVLDISSCGMRLKTTVTAKPGETLRIDLPEFTLLAEVMHCEPTPVGIEMGVRLLHSLKRQQLCSLVGPGSPEDEFTTLDEPHW